MVISHYTMPAVLDALHKAVTRENLSSEQASAALDEILDGGAPASLVSALLVALRMKGEAVEEVVGFARALRRRALRVECGEDPRPLIDTCGTGGDSAGTFNISTAAAFVVAGAGARVAKHGNRSISSHCGSADVLEELGAKLDPAPAEVARAVNEIGIGFLFAPAFHPAMRQVQPVRTELKMRTIFNLLGPLANPAGAPVQVVGVFDERVVDLVAAALAQLGMRRGMVVHGGDGLDEVTTTGPTTVAEIAGGKVSRRTWFPEDFGVERSTGEQLAGGDRHQNAAIVRAVLGGEKGPPRDIVLVNAAAALIAADLAPDPAAAMRLAGESIDSGQALEKLTRFIEFSRR